MGEMRTGDLASFSPMTVHRLAALLADESDADRRWLLLLEFLEEYEHAPSTQRARLVRADPPTTGDDHWDALLAGVVEWLAARDELPAPAWVNMPGRILSHPWSPYSLASLQRLAADNAPPEIRRHGILVDPYDLNRA